MCGSRDFADWCPAWIIELALKHGAVLVQPDYRLLPEAVGEQILDDMDDFWAWLGRDLPSIVQENGIEVDMDHVLISGESAGGYLALQIALSFYLLPAPQPRVLVSSFPMLYLRSARYTQRYHKQILDMPQLPESLIDAHLASIANAPKDKRPVVSSTPMASGPLVGTPRGALTFALIQHGRFADVLGQDRDPAPGRRRLHPEDRVADGRVLPPTLFIHGIGDSVAPVDATDQFTELLREKKAVAGLEEGKEALGYIKVPGEHGFHSNVKLGDAKWTDEAVSFIERHWIGE